MPDEIDNPPAFPPNAGWRDDDPNCRGLSIRDYFAAKAMAGLMMDYAINESSKDTVEDIKREKGFISSREAIVFMSYKYADAMLAARQAANPKEGDQ